MQALVTQHPGLNNFAFVPLFAVLWVVGGYLVALTSGWRSLAQRYRAERQFPEHRRRMQSARMRAATGYNNILTLGSDADGVYLRIPALFAMGHAPLLVPWSDIQVEEPKQRLLCMTQTLCLGPDGIPLRVREHVAQFLLEGRRNVPAEPSGGRKWGI